MGLLDEPIQELSADVVRRVARILSKRGLALAKNSFTTPISQILDLCCEHLECKQEILRGKNFCKEFPLEEESTESF